MRAKKLIAGSEVKASSAKTEVRISKGRLRGEEGQYDRESQSVFPILQTAGIVSEDAFVQVFYFKRAACVRIRAALITDRL